MTIELTNECLEKVDKTNLSKNGADDNNDDYFDNLLDALGDNSASKKVTASSQPGSSSSGKQTTSANKEKDESFYEALANQAKSMGANDNDSDISEADPVAMSRDTNFDDMESNLFKSGKKPTDTNKKTEQASGRLFASGPVSNDRPPTRSGQKSAVVETDMKKKNMDDTGLFDNDDDLLDGLGLDSPRPSTKKPSLIPAESENARPALSVLDDLLGGGKKKSESAAAGGTGTTPVQRSKSKDPMDDFLSSLTSTKKPVDDDPGNDDLGFGGYMPSTMTSSRPSSKRSVRFEEDSGTRRPASQPGYKSRDPIFDSAADDSKSWLDMASGATKVSGKSSDLLERPRSEGSLSDKPTPQRSSLQQNPEPQEDWLGFNRIGSPNTTPRQKEESDSMTSNNNRRDSQLARELGLSNVLPTTKISSSKTPYADLDSDLYDIMAPSAVPRKKSTIVADIDPLIPPDPEMPSAKKTARSDDEQRTIDWLGDIDDDGLMPQRSNRRDTATGGGGGGGVLRKDSADADIDLTSRRQPRRQSADRVDLDFETHVSSGSSKPPSAVKKPLRPSDDDLFADIGSFSKNPRSIDEDPFSDTPISKSLPWDFGGMTDTTKVSKEPSQRQQSHTSMPQRPSALFDDDSLLEVKQPRGRNDLVPQRDLETSYEPPKQNQQVFNQRPITSRIPMNSLQASSAGGLVDERDNYIRQLESEKQFLQKMIETNKQQYDEEKKSLVGFYEDQLKLSEETFRKREERLKLENELMSTEIVEKMRMVEKEKSSLFAMHLQKLSDLETERRSEIERLKENHRHALEDLQNEHQSALDRVVKSKLLELDAMAHSRDHAKTLENAVNRIGENASGLQELQSMISQQHASTLTEREAVLLARDERLKALQDSLERQQHANDMERARLQGLVTKLELQLTEQARELEQEKWRVRTEESNLKAAQSSLEQERLRLVEQLQRDRMELDRAKDKFIEEQQTRYTELNRERSQLTEQQAEFNISMKLKNEEQQRVMAKAMQNDSEIQGAMRSIMSERAKLTEWQAELEALAEKLKSDRQQLDQQQRLLNAKEQTLNNLGQQIRDKSAEIDEFVTESTQARQEGQKALSMARQIELEHKDRLARIQTELEALHVKQKQIAEERLSLSREKAAFEAKRGAVVCSICRTPIRDVPSVDAAEPIAAVMQPTSRRSSSSGAPLMRSRLGDIYKAIEQDLTVRTFRQNANRDHEFLQEEGYYLQMLKRAPYHSSQLSS